MPSIRVRVELNTEGVRDLLRSEEVRRDLKRRADNVRTQADVLARSPNGHFSDSRIGPNRARAAVVTRTPKAALMQARNSTLVRATIQAARN